MSWYQHHASLSPAAYEAFLRAPGLGAPLGPPTQDVRAYFHEWLDRDGYPVAPFWPHVQSWWDVRGLDNVLLVHFAALKRDLEAEMRRVAAFLGVELGASLWPAVVERCTFDYMRRNAASLSRRLDAGFKGGAQSFFHGGTNGRWRDVLTADDAAKYERLAAANLTPDCARWLATGNLPECAS
jgi:aryl sulfotransferase